MEAIYYIWGAEDYLIDQKVQELIHTRQQETHGETEVVWLDTEEMRPQEWAQELEFSPLFQLSRMVIMKRPPWLAGEKKRVKDEKIVRDVLEAYIAAPPQGQILVVTSRVKTGSPIVKMFEKSAVFIECPKLNARQLQDWLQQEIQALNCRAENAGFIRKLADSGQDLYYLSQLLQKLVLLAPDGVLRADMLENQVEYKQEIKIFKLIDGVLERRLNLAITALHQLFRQGEAEIYILYMLNRQFTLYAQVKALSEEGRTQAEIEKQTGQKSFTVKKMLERSRKYRWPEIESGLEQILQTDVELKSTGKNPQILLETLIFQLIEGYSD